MNFVKNVNALCDEVFGHLFLKYSDCMVREESYLDFFFNENFQVFLQYSKKYN